MEELEKKYYKLINCLGNLDTTNSSCGMCKYAYSCLEIRRELKGEEFEKGKYRFGFGRRKIE